MFVNEGVDLISTLPDPLLGVIVSLLPGSEGVRTCVLSQRWKMVWKHAFHLHFDQKKMLHRGQGEINADVIARSESLINFLLDSHNGPLKSCTIQHLVDSCTSGKVVEWIRKLCEEKKVKKLSMKVYEPGYLRALEYRTPDFMIFLGGELDFPFEIFSALEELELKNYNFRTSPSNNVPSQVLKSLIFSNVTVDNDAMQGILLYCLCLENLTLEDCKFLSVVKMDNSRLKFFKICRMIVSEIEVSASNLEILEIDTVVCSQKLAFDTPKVRVLRSCFDGSKIDWRVQPNLLQPRNILYSYSSSQTSEGSTSSFAKIFENMSTLSINLDLKRVENAAALFSALASCPMLQNLEINSEAQVNNGPWYYNSDDQNEDDCLPYPKILFWNRREFCECINHKLKSLSIKGFVGEELEIEFLKYIITTAEAMKKITTWFVDDCSWAQAIATRCLLSFPKASRNLSIILKPGPLFMKNVDENFETWVSTLED